MINNKEEWELSQQVFLVKENKNTIHFFAEKQFADLAVAKFSFGWYKQKRHIGRK